MISACTRQATRASPPIYELGLCRVLPSFRTTFSQLHPPSTMATDSPKPKEWDGAVSTVDLFIEVFNLAKELSSVTPARAVFGSVAVILTTIKVSLANRQDCIELGQTCVEICCVLDRGTKGKGAEHLNQLVRDAINRARTTVAEIERNVQKQSKRNAASRLFHAKNDKDKIAGWASDLNKILQIFNTELAIDTNVTASNTHNIVSETHNVVSGTQNIVSETQNMVSDLHRAAFKPQGASDGQVPPTHTSVSGESPPQPPRACFGRDELIEEVVGLAENLKPIALIGAGGIGKTSIALKVLHHDRIKKRFGDNRRFIRCDKFPVSLPHFLNRLSKVIGAGIENPEDLTSLQSFLSSKDMILVLDNAESILDPQGTDAREIYAAVQELSRFSNICLGITSRITTVPPHFKRPMISTLSPEAACDIFYSIYGDGGRSEVISDLIRQLDFHALSITLLATTASHNTWDHTRLAKEWNVQRAQVLQTDYNESLAATIELSLASPTFRNLGPHARDLLGVIAFLPQGIDEKNLDWLFPTIPNRKNIFNKFCILSLTSRSNNFITMLAPIRDHLRPRDPKLSPLLCATKDCYFSRLSVFVSPGWPGFEEARWVVSEDVNAEHLLEVFTSIDTNSEVVWDAFAGFMRRLYWHKPRHTVLGPRVEGLVDDHHSKPRCLIWLAKLSYTLGNYSEQKQLLSQALKLTRERENDSQVAETLILLSGANEALGLHDEGIQQMKEALAIYERFSITIEQASCWKGLSRLFRFEGRLDEAEKAGLHAIELLPEKGEEFKLCQTHQSLGAIYGDKREKEKAICHFKKALGIASSSGWLGQLFSIHYALAFFFARQDELDKAHSHIDQAKSHAADNPLRLGRAMDGKAQIWYRQSQLEDALTEASGALEIFEKLGASTSTVCCKDLLKNIERAIAARDAPSSG
ncbi:hypothetical protein BJ322DRAFT_1215335 [Thelephora terrestris]|uniref:Uncharacterized protein n=1 Tax=Thelephora terrestris TaxID=56493 RepID=A0A9P6HPL0_9AGAM|nr:hypothetical protein BJ322DRAFT_1215335 [Thelephora terrestris]